MNPRLWVTLEAENSVQQRYLKGHFVAIAKNL